MSAMSPSGTLSDRWVRRDLLDVFDVPLPAGARDLGRVVTDSLALGGTPFLIGRGHPGFEGLDLVSAALESLGGLEPVLDVAPARRRTNGSRTVLSGAGPTKPPRVPEQLVWAPFSKVPPPQIRSLGVTV